MRFYATESLGGKQQMTPEGFLVCLDVPIARTGTQMYGAGETPAEPGKDGLVKVVREADEVFKPEAIASFSGKPVVNDHPVTGVDPTNWKELAVGVVMNPRRGLGAQDDVLLADLLITDASAIAAVRDGKREVSCGYDADYDQIEAGVARQRNIIGNHVALVQYGRCGSRCSIGDEDMTTKKTWTDRLLAAFKAKDENGMAEALKEAEKETKDTESEELKERMGKMEDSLSKLTGDIKTVKDSLGTVQKWIGTNGAKKDDPNPAAADGALSEWAKEEEKEAEHKTTDSVSMEDEFTATVALAEIVAPGIKLPTFDAGLAPKSTKDRLCALRRRSLIAATTAESTKDTVSALLGGRTIDKLSCDEARLVFDGTAELVRRANNTKSTTRQATTATADKKDGAINTLADVNKRNRELYGQPTR